MDRQAVAFCFVYNDIGQGEFTVTKTDTLNYEKVYFTLWETAQRYSSFCQFRVIGNSHDDRMIPMLELGSGQDAVFCLAGLDGTDAVTPQLLVNMAREYCQAYECGWQLDNFYEVRKLLDRVRICLIPLLNPDGYEICRGGFTVIRNPIYRQMLRMQSIPYQEFAYNARGMDIRHNFPTAYYTRQWAGQEPASENETKALIRIFQEYKSCGLLSFTRNGKKIIYYRNSQGYSSNQKTYRLARHLQKRSDYHLEKYQPQETQERGKRRVMGTPEQFYMQIVKKPAFLIETPGQSGEQEDMEKIWKKAYEEIYLLPLEYIFSIEE